MALKTGVLLLSSCWKHYSMLLRLEDHQFPYRISELIDQFLSGIEVVYLFMNHKHDDLVSEARVRIPRCCVLTVVNK